MTDVSFTELDAESQQVLICIANGTDDVNQITQATGLANGVVNRRFTKLEELDLITVTKPEGRVERIIDGQNRNFQAPKEATLTAAGADCIDIAEAEVVTDRPEDEYAERLRQLEAAVDDLHRKIEILRKQVQDKL